MTKFNGIIIERIIMGDRKVVDAIGCPKEDIERLQQMYSLAPEMLKIIKELANQKYEGIWAPKNVLKARKLLKQIKQIASNK